MFPRRLRGWSRLALHGAFATVRHAQFTSLRNSPGGLVSAEGCIAELFPHLCDKPSLWLPRLLSSSLACTFSMGSDAMRYEQCEITGRRCDSCRGSCVDFHNSDLAIRCDQDNLSTCAKQLKASESFEQLLAIGISFSNSNLSIAHRATS